MRLREVRAKPDPASAAYMWRERLAAIPEPAEPIGPWYWLVFERVFAAVVLLFSLPVLAIIAVIVKLDSPGPVLFRQWRIGRGGKLFRFTKLRTYHVDARERFPHLYAYRYSEDEINRLCFKTPGDPRATRAGRWLRKSTLDELPNFWHVLTGDMALVGPRPEIPEMLPYYEDSDLLKFTVRPGVTGMAQVSGRGHLSFRDTIRLDLHYVRSRTVAEDFRIIATTIPRILFKEGAF